MVPRGGAVPRGCVVSGESSQYLSGALLEATTALAVAPQRLNGQVQCPLSERQTHRLIHCRSLFCIEMYIYFLIKVIWNKSSKINLSNWTIFTSDHLYFNAISTLVKLKNRKSFIHGAMC